MKKMETMVIEKRIYTVRNVQVMIDRDLAELYGVENRVLRQAVSPVGNYMAMAYSRKLGPQPANFLQEIYNHEQGW